jgi:hypothetical protein
VHPFVKQKLLDPETFSSMLKENNIDAFFLRRQQIRSRLTMVQQLSLDIFKSWRISTMLQTVTWQKTTYFKRHLRVKI